MSLPRPPYVCVLLLLVAAVGAACGDEPTVTAPTPSPVTETFSSQVGPAGAASRTFSFGAAGSVRVTLSSTTPSGIALGLAVGIPRATGSGCLPTRTVLTTASSTPQLVITADAGAYCAQV